MTQSEKPTLEPCPFCGGNGVIREDHGRYYATCDGVDCFVCVGESYDRDAMPDHLFLSEEDAAAAWNRRS